MKQIALLLIECLRNQYFEHGVRNATVNLRAQEWFHCHPLSPVSLTPHSMAMYSMCVVDLWSPTGMLSASEEVDPGSLMGKKSVNHYDPYILWVGPPLPSVIIRRNLMKHGFCIRCSEYS